MQTNEKHIELADRIFDQCPSLHPDQVDGASFVSEAAPIIAQALAAAREEGRRDMRDECLHVVKQQVWPLDGQIRAHSKISWKNGHTHAKNEIRSAIRNLPTNAPEPEGESE